MKQILLLEDDPGLQKTYGFALRRCGHKVEIVSTCDAAIESLTDRSPELLILDLKIGRGMSLTVADYASFRWPEVPILYVTGSGMFPNGELFSLSTSARLVLRKPINLKDLTSTVEHLQSAPAPVSARDLAVSSS